MKHLSSTTKFFLGIGCAFIGGFLFSLNTALFFSLLMGDNYSTLLELPLNLTTFLCFGLPMLACFKVYILCSGMTINKKARLGDWVKSSLPLLITILSGIAALDNAFSGTYGFATSALMHLPVTEVYLIKLAALFIVYLLVTTVQVLNTNIIYFKEENHN
jgi:hypothetical protein